MQVFSKERPGLDEKSFFLVIYPFLGLPIPHQFICILPNSPSMTLPGQKSLMIPYKKFGSILFPLPAWNLPFLMFWGLQKTAAKLLFSSKKQNQITLAPVRLIPQKSPRGNYSLITYSCLLFILWPDSASWYKSGQVPRLPQRKLIYASWQSGCTRSTCTMLVFKETC